MKFSGRENDLSLTRMLECEWELDPVQTSLVYIIDLVHQVKVIDAFGENLAS